MTAFTRRHFVQSAGTLGLAAATGAFANRDARVLTAADVHVDGYPTVEAVRWMSRKIETETGGRLRLRVYHSGQLGRETDTVELARFGAIDLTRVNFAPLTNPFPLTQLFAMPYVFDSVAHMRRVVDGPVGKAVLQGFESRDLVGLAIYDAGSRNFYDVRGPIHAPADLHGLKIRVPPSDIFLDMARAFGANPTPLPVGDVYSALQTRLIDGAENNWRTFHTSRAFEVARYVSQTGHSHSPEALLMSRRTFDRLDTRDRELVLHAATQSVAYMRSLWDPMEASSKQEVLKAGVQLNDVDGAAFRQAAGPVVQEYVRRGGFQKLYDLMRAAA
jgi:tripartite ATP-independent transporter DctP family solute receptor